MPSPMSAFANKPHALTKPQARRWFNSVTRQDLRKVLALIRKQGALSIRDIDDDVLVEREHP
jgi:hypothetical protein